MTTATAPAFELAAQASTALSLTYFTDPGHGWLQVPVECLQRLDIAAQITPYSYMRGGMAYLEEDCDAPRFLQAAKAAGWVVKCAEQNSNRDSFIRSLPRFVA